MSELYSNVGLQVIPALDVYQGKTVRIQQGEVDAGSEYAAPVDIAHELVEQGASMIHLVDLDKAYAEGNNFALLAEVIGAIKVPVQLSGGIMNEEDVNAAFDMGVRRVNLASQAVGSMRTIEKMNAKYGSALTLSIDVDPENLFIKPRGSKEILTDSHGQPLGCEDTIRTLSELGISRFVVTDITRDGSMNGPNIQLLRKALNVTDKQIIASGGISSLKDIRALRELTDEGLEALILGKALYEGKFTLKAANEVATR